MTIGWLVPYCSTAVLVALILILPQKLKKTTTKNSALHCSYDVTSTFKAGKKFKAGQR